MIEFEGPVVALPGVAHRLSRFLKPGKSRPGRSREQGHPSVPQQRFYSIFFCFSLPTSGTCKRHPSRCLPQNQNAYTRPQTFQVLKTWKVSPRKKPGARPSICSAAAIWRYLCTTGRRLFSKLTSTADTAQYGL